MLLCYSNCFFSFFLLVDFIILNVETFWSTDNRQSPLYLAESNTKVRFVHGKCQFLMREWNETLNSDRASVLGKKNYMQTIIKTSTLTGSELSCKVGHTWVLAGVTSQVSWYSGKHSHLVLNVFIEERIYAFDENPPFWDYKLWCVMKNNSPESHTERKSLQRNLTAFGIDLSCFHLNTDL